MRKITHNIPIQEDEQTIASSPVPSSFMNRNKPVIFGILAFITLGTLMGMLTNLRYQIVKEDYEEDTYSAVHAAKDRLQETLAFGLSAAKTLSFFIDNKGMIKDFDSLAAEILSSGKYIDAIELVPNGVITNVYPLAGNEKVIGYDILHDPATSAEAYKAIAKKEFFFAGPLHLKQGGMAVVGRLPIFRDGKFWGFSAIIIKVPNLLRAAGIDSSGQRGFYFQLSKINPNTLKEEFFMPMRPHHYSNTISIDLPNGEWKLSATPVGPQQGYSDLFILIIMRFFFAILAGFLVYKLVKSPQKLNQLVKERTAQLKESEKNYKTLFGKSPLPLWIYDLETYKFLEVNEAAIAIYGYSREEFLEMDATMIRPKADLERFYEKAKSGSTNIHDGVIWTHNQKNGKEMQVLIFSRDIRYNNRDGRLVLVMDVSEKVKTERALIESEEKYRTLIEQASDGVILYSFDGTIHEFNKSVQTLAGYTREEFAKLNLTDILFEKKVIINKARADKMMTGASTIIYRKVKRKDGAILEVELTAKMLPDGKIIAFVRDITERIKAEIEVRQMNRQLRELSGHLESIREEERTNIAREIHDELGQQLTGLKMDMSWLNRKINGNDIEIKQKVQSVLGLIDDTIRTVRKIATELRPSMLDDLGLIAAMEWQSEEFEKRFDVKVRFINNIGDLVVQAEVSTMLFRIYQELLTNVARHAHAGNITAAIGINNDQLCLSVTDDGKGFDLDEILNRKTLGLMGIKERTLLVEGQYEIITRPNEGTTVLITVPIDKAISKI